ncbi:hypothetical protein ACFLW1_00650 [Chloroflexota bacterium]
MGKNMEKQKPALENVEYGEIIPFFDGLGRERELVMLDGAGFYNVHREDWRETEHRDHDDFSRAYLPHIDKENGTLVSLNIEAEKLGAA